MTIIATIPRFPVNDPTLSPAYLVLDTSWPRSLAMTVTIDGYYRYHHRPQHCKSSTSMVSCFSAGQDGAELHPGHADRPHLDGLQAARRHIRIVGLE